MSESAAPEPDTPVADAPPPNRVGRPRDPGIEQAILRATHELLVEVGYQGLTMRAVAERAGVSAPTVYLRWPNKVALVEDLVFPTGTDAPPASSGDLRGDLYAWVVTFTRSAGDPAARVAIPGLLSSYNGEPAGHQRLVVRSEAPARSALDAVLHAAVERGEARADYDVETLFDLLRGATVLRGLLCGTEGLEPFARRVADALWRLTQPAAP
jgi:AcrR family transcriptional regulator